MVIDIANLSYFHFDLMFEIGLNRERIKQIMDDIKKVSAWSPNLRM